MSALLREIFDFLRLLQEGILRLPVKTEPYHGEKPGLGKCGSVVAPGGVATRGVSEHGRFRVDQITRTQRVTSHLFETVKTNQDFETTDKAEPKLAPYD